MPSKEKRYRGSQYVITYPVDIPFDSVFEVIQGNIKASESELKVLIITSNRVLLKTSTGLNFYGETSFIVKENKPTIELIPGKDKGLFDKIFEFKGDPSHKVIHEDYRDQTKTIKMDEESGHMFTRMRTNPDFDPTTCTKFGRGYRRVEPIKGFNKIVGWKFVPFSDYGPVWASDIYGYDSFEDALEDIYPYQIKEIKALKELYAARPRITRTSSMVLTPWQKYLESILDEPTIYGEQQRNFFWFADFVGLVGKSMLVKHMKTVRDDTIFISMTGKMSDLIYSVKDRLDSSSKIKNIIFDLPREIPEDKMRDSVFNLFGDAKFDTETIKFMEICANGEFTSTKYESAMFDLDHGLRVIVLSNSLPLLPASSLDRWRINLIKDMHDLQVKDLRCHEHFPRITTRKDTVKFYLSQPAIVEYMEKNGFRTEEPKPFVHKID